VYTERKFIKNTLTAHAGSDIMLSIVAACLNIMENAQSSANIKTNSAGMKHSGKPIF